VIKMLKGIPTIISPELLKILSEMGHGDELVLGDGNFPSEAYGKRVVRCDGHGIPQLLEAILTLFPLDRYVDAPVALMDVVPGDTVPEPEIWDTYERIVSSADPQAKAEHMERFAFYERAKAAYAVVATGESAIYANIILKKGVVTA
jgi:L-fucose mutarotase